MASAGGLRALPWKRIIAVAQVVLKRVGDDIPAKDRKRLNALVRRSKGDPRNLTPAERTEMVAILRKVDVKKLGAEVASLLAMARSGRLLRG